MNTIRTSNKKCRQYVQAKQAFKAHNLFGEWQGDKYVVYSYGYHFPMFVWVHGAWHANQDKYSVSTSKQYNQAHPLGNVIPCSTQELKSLLQ